MSLSVILSVYHKENPSYLHDSLFSISNQLYLPSNVIIVIDGPIDDKLKNVINDWRDLVTFQVLIIKLNVNKGLSIALNKALLECNTEYIARVDTDDINLINRFKRQIEFLEKNTQVDVVGSFISEINENGNVIKDCVKYPLSHRDCFEFFKKRDPLAHPAVMFRKSFFIKAGLYSEKHVYPYNYEDTILWYKGFKYGCVFANIPEVLLHFRRSEDFYLRRGGYKKAFNFLIDRLKIIRDLKLGKLSKLYALAYFCLAISPPFVKRILYTKLR
ncbi:glycosyltransferase [Photobacterium kishitanii]|uniref:glycosyltransferase n=1 Tax=Photobacterium kishitanii TaxID=318456 RepID=UPI00071AF0F7|nr:glycosyltransferase [Photobacterium kishitanii]